MARWPWFDRTFDFSYPVGKFPELLERVRGTPARLEERLRGVPDAVLAGSDGRGWSIKRNVGHLTDLEPIHLRRLAQLLAGETQLAGADLTNSKSCDAPHDSRPIEQLLRDFRTIRAEFVERFAAVPEADWGRSGIHPRLQQPMRIVDIVCFTAEHDDYHMARIAELLSALGKG